MLLEVVDHIQLEIEQVNQINERAHAEISIRESLRELEVWSGLAEFTLAEENQNKSGQGLGRHTGRVGRSTTTDGDVERVASSGIV